MSAQNLDKLATLIRRDRESLLSGWREQVKALPSAKDLDAPTLNDHLPGLLEELAAALEERSGETIAEALKDGSPLEHGLQRLQDGFDIGEVVAEYNILRGSIHDLAAAGGLNIQGEAFHILNKVLDGAIGLAVETYAAQRALDVKKKREEYLAFVAHDLRTPLNALSLAARALDMALPAQNGDPENARMIKTLHRNVGHLEAIVKKVLEENSSDQAEGEPKLVRRTFDLWPLVEALVHNVHPETGTVGTRLINEVPDDLVVYADAGLLGRVFQNLIANAIEYTPDGEVRLGAKQQADGMTECWVTDNGAGIPGDLLGKVFEKGESDPEKDGTGLGLAIVKTFVEAHGGTVHAESEEGHGTTIRFTLPGAETSSA